MKDSTALCGIANCRAGHLPYQLRHNESHDDREEYSTENRGQSESFCLTLSKRRSLAYRNQSIDLL